MKIENTTHPTQTKIIKYLAFNVSARFTDLNTDKLPNDHFNFHIKKLVTEGVLIKNNRNLYELTLKGKQILSGIDIINLEVEKTPKVSVLVAPIRNHKGKTEYLVQKRLKQPYYGYCGSVTGKVKFGESIHEAANRELKEETGLSGDLLMKGIKHKLYYDKNKKPIADAYFFLFIVKYIKGKLVNTQEGENFWISKDNMDNKKIKWFPDYKNTLKILNNTDLNNFFELIVDDTGF